MNKPRAGEAMAVAVSVVVIGRNEGERLSRCLRSVQQAAWGELAYELIYVDSRSSDGSVERARAEGAQVLVLDDASPCAAKARNLGWQVARGAFILFLDGDTELHPDFVPAALRALDDDRLCAAWGHRRESRPEQSIYNRVLDLDWVYPVGKSLYFGGDVLVRTEALRAVGGFDPALKAGEEPEMCARLRAAGWEIVHIDQPMTRHDLAVTSWRAYWLRAYRSGIAYAEVAERMRLRGDVLWQRESRRDYRHGLLFLASPVLLLALLWWAPWLALGAVLVALGMLARTAKRCAWKAPGQWWLCTQYAVHTHFQKIPALFGQWAWRRAQRQRRVLGLVDYKEAAPAASGRWRPKAVLVALLAPLAWGTRVVGERWRRLWALARLQEALGVRVDASNVVLGPVELHGTRRIRFGKGALIYPGVYLETQGQGSIDIGDGVVLSRGVHIVAFERVVLAHGCMVGEYSSIRDANHVTGSADLRHSGHRSAGIDIGEQAWIGRGAAVLMGASVGAHAVVAANAVVHKPVAARTVVGGVPARRLRDVDPGQGAAASGVAA